MTTNMKYNKDQIHEIVEVFYQNQFKTFYINSQDGKTFTKPFGVFVSLGMATSIKSLENIRDILNNYEGITAELAEIKSKKITSQFMNCINKIGNDVKQFELTEVPDNCFNKQQALDYIQNNQNIDKQKWESLIEKIDNSEDGWGPNLIQLLPELNDLRIYRKFVNYKDDSDVEYRIGIYVC